MTAFQEKIGAGNDILARGRRCHLRHFQEDMISNEYIAWLNDKDLMRFSRHRSKVHTLEMCQTYCRSIRGAGNLFFAVVNNETEGLIGTMTVYVDRTRQSADVGILIGRDWAGGKGYGREAWGEAMAVLFSRYQLQEVTGGTDARHMAMIRIFEYWGMQRLDELTDKDAAADASQNIYYRITADQWRTRLNDRP